MGAGPLLPASPSLPRLLLAYARRQWLELPANVLEGTTLVLVVFVQDVAFKHAIAVSAGLLTASFGLHGLAYRRGQCQVWPKVIEVAAPLLFYGLLPPALLHEATTKAWAFVVINLWFVEVVAWAWLGRNFMLEYYEDWNEQQAWGTPLLSRCAWVVCLNWVACQLLMAGAQVVVVLCGLSLRSHLAATIVMAYAMQLLPLLWAVAFTFAYPAHLKRAWRYVPGQRDTAFPPGQRGGASAPGPGSCCRQAVSDVRPASSSSSSSNSRPTGSGPSGTGRSSSVDAAVVVQEPSCGGGRLLDAGEVG